MIAKRLFDLICVVPGLIVLAPVLLVLAIWVKLDSPGPVLFRQERVGRFGRPFQVLKFRTMVVDADRRGGKLTVEGDSRVTRVGALLRNRKLDELPQLWNVLKGEMSLVGPRPEVPEYLAYYPAGVRDRVLSVPPGMTDFAAIEFRDESGTLAQSEDPHRTYVEQILPRKLALYERYVSERSVWLDLRLVLKTIRSVVGS